MNKTDIVRAIAAMCDTERAYEITPRYLQFFTPNGDPVAMSAQSTHIQNAGEPWKKSNKRRINK